MAIIKIILLYTTFSNVTIDHLRLTYFTAAENKEKLNAFEKSVEMYPKKDHHYFCYLSAYYSLQSKHSSSLSKKLNFFNSCKTSLEKSFAIKESFDAHFIRFCIQTNVPSILAYNKQIDVDKKYILANINKETNSEFKTNIKLFMLKSTALSQTEKETLNKL